MGLIVEEIIDIVEDQLNVQLESAEPHLLGSAVVGGKATGIIDTAHYLTKAYGDWFERRGKPGAGVSAHGERVLLIDDSPFFRNLITPLLTTAGYLVVTADDAESALAARDDGEGFDTIISDIEMPGMSGFEFAAEVKNDDRWKDIPLIAVSAYTGADDLTRGREAGFVDYIAKNDRDAILSGIADAIAGIGETKND